MKVYKIFDIAESLTHLCEENIKLPLNIAYNLTKKKSEIEEITNFVSERINLLIDNEHLEKNELSSEEEIIYSTIMESEMDIQPISLNIEEVFNSTEISLSVTDVENICLLFEKL